MPSAALRALVSTAELNLRLYGDDTDVLMSIRQAEVSDAVTLARLNAPVQALHRQGNAAFFREATLEQVAEWFTERLASTEAHAWVLEDEGVAEAYVLVVQQERAATPFTEAVRRFEIDQVGVLPSARRRGHARRLMEHVCTRAREAGASEVILRSWAFNSEAHSAFKRLGFQAQVVQFARSL